MIKLAESILLASTKLKMRKIRLAITVIISALLFAGLVFLANIADGALRSLKDFSKEGYGSRYFVQATPLTYTFNQGPAQSTIDQLMPTTRDLISQKSKAAKKLDIPYDQTTDFNLPVIIPPSRPNSTISTESFLNYQSTIVQELIAKKNVEIPGTSYDFFKKTAQNLKALRTYRGTTGGIGSFIPSGELKIIVNEKEDFKDDSEMQQGSQNISGIDSINTLGWRAVDDDLLKPFLLENQNLEAGSDNSVPIIAPFSAAEQMLGLKPLPQTAAPKQKIERLSFVRSKIAGKIAQLCYRNSESANLVSQAVQQQREITLNKNKKDYVLPSLVYELPTVACEPATVKSDKRTAEDKKQANNQRIFDLQFNQRMEPIQKLMRIRIVGISPDGSNGASVSALVILNSLFSSSTGIGWVSPGAALDKNDTAILAQGGTIESASRDKSVYYAEFGSLADMERFINSQTCKEGSTIVVPEGTFTSFDQGNNGFENCVKQGKTLTISPYGNSAGAIEQFRRAIWNVTQYAIVAVVLIAVLIMMGNVGKIISDSRRETAVFRALGAKRLDIIQIYVTYTIFISFLVGLFAFLVGGIGAKIVSNLYSPDLSAVAVLTYNAKDVHKQFSLYSVNPIYFCLIFGIIILASLISVVLPLMRNVRRNPIRDMRDDS